jgi:hypothetical protein
MGINYRIVPDINDVEISKMHLQYIVRLVKRAKMQMLLNLFREINCGQDNPIFYWIKLYSETIPAPESNQYKVVQGIFEKIMDSPAILNSEKRLLNSMFVLVKEFARDLDLTEAEQYELAEDLVFFTIKHSVSP